MKSKGLKSERIAKKRTSKIVDRLTYSPKKHKNKIVRDMRDKLQAKKVPTTKIPVDSQTLKFGSFNVNGLDLEAGWAVKQLLTKRGFDLSIIHSKNSFNISSPGSCIE